MESGREAISAEVGKERVHGQGGPATAPVVVVSGLPRSGTSLMMQMLAAGGLPVLTDGRRERDPSNPRGYLEFEPAKRLREDAGWMGQACGRAVKIVSPLLRYLPAGLVYRVVFMERAMPQILASQRAMLARLGEAESAQIDDALMAARFAEHLTEVKAWLARQPHVQVLYVDYNAAVASRAGVEEAARRVAAFLGGGLDVAAMVGALDPALYRERQQGDQA